MADALRLAGNGNAGQVDWQRVVPALAESAVTALLDARAREGERLADMLQDRLSQLRASGRASGALVPQLVEQQRQRFLERWQEAMGLTEGQVPPEAAHDRALSEATAFAIRIDVAEEITRLEVAPRRSRAPAEKGRRNRQAPGLPRFRNCTARPIPWAPIGRAWS